MTFGEQDGTGMGEGAGHKDVSDQIENEEQLLGLKQDEKDEDDLDKDQDSKQQQREEKKLGKEEQEQGVEMSRL